MNLQRLAAHLSRFALYLGLCTVFGPIHLGAQSSDTVMTAAGAQYQAGFLHRWLLGRHYRDLWTTPIAVKTLDLEGFAGGLEILRRGGGRQTKSLRFLGADGREYSFRSVDKDPSAILDPLLRETLVADLLQDGISSAHPFGALVSAPLLDALGILHADPALYVMPDDPRLGDFRADFAGVLGMLEENPDENTGGVTAFRAADRVVGSEVLMERINASPADQVDARAFLTARMLDLVLGDWDRHRDQWRWATYGTGDARLWEPVPKDRDQAFSKFDGIIPRIVSVYVPQFVRFEASYPGIVRLHWNGRELDRRFLSGLQRSAWDSIGASAQERLTNEVIRDAVRQLPPEIMAINGEGLGSALEKRRDALSEAWSDFYRMLATHVDVQGTAASELATIRWSDAGTVEVTISARGAEDRPYFRRVFNASETREVRVYLAGGDDRVVVDGVNQRSPTVRVIGGRGDDSYEVRGVGGELRLYDSEGDNALTAPPGLHLDGSNFDEWVWTEEDRDQPRDWGSARIPLFWSSASSDVGPFIGAGVRLERYGFRSRPFSAAANVRVGYAPARTKGRAEVDVRLNHENSAVYQTLRVRASQLDVIHYYGLGNDAPAGDERFHRVDGRAVSAGTGVGASLGRRTTVEVGVMISASSSKSNEGRFFEGVRDTLYGATGFASVGATTRMEFGLSPGEVPGGVVTRAHVGGTFYPAALDAESTYGSIDGEVSTTFAPLSVASLTLRAGGRKVWGAFPWQEAAFLGGAATLRGWDEQRFAGDASVYARAEGRLRLFHPRIVLPVATGVFGFLDAGRVFLDGASPGGWHGGAGGGIWMTPAGRGNTLTVGLGSSEERTKFYVGLGIPY